MPTDLLKRLITHSLFILDKTFERSFVVSGMHNKVTNVCQNNTTVSLFVNHLFYPECLIAYEKSVAV